ncbi:TPA: MBL fold metallo-hydrolase, partial [Streptococcus suis]|nr:MBL fold metallo-hydrolase [Streptococcus suis]
MSCVKREILPVGQGAFYLETLMLRGNEYRVIYDCGSATDVTYVETQIKANLNKNEEIHAVFISHLDDDHMNGLEFLIQHCNVRHLFFPLITSETRELNELMNVINEIASSSFVSNFISTNGQGIENSDVVLHPIPAEHQEGSLIDETSEAIFGTGVEVDWVY